MWPACNYDETIVSTETYTPYTVVYAWMVLLPFTLIMSYTIVLDSTASVLQTHSCINYILYFGFRFGLWYYWCLNWMSLRCNMLSCFFWLHFYIFDFNITDNLCIHRSSKKVKHQKRRNLCILFIYFLNSFTEKHNWLIVACGM